MPQERRPAEKARSLTHVLSFKMLRADVLVAQARRNQRSARDDDVKREEGGTKEKSDSREKGGILYYVLCMHRHGIPPPRGLLHGRFFSSKNDHPTIVRSANNTGK